MPPNDDERLVGHFADLTVAWQQHREVINRSVGLLAQEIFSQARQVEAKLSEFKARLDDDDKNRTSRQQQLDAALAHLASEIRGIRRWQWLRIGIEVAAVLIALALLAGARWL